MTSNLFNSFSVENSGIKVFFAPWTLKNFDGHTPDEENRQLQCCNFENSFHCSGGTSHPLIKTDYSRETLTGHDGKKCLWHRRPLPGPSACWWSYVRLSCGGGGGGGHPGPTWGNSRERRVLAKRRNGDHEKEASTAVTFAGSSPPNRGFRKIRLLKKAHLISSCADGTAAQTHLLRQGCRARALPGRTPAPERILPRRQEGPRRIGGGRSFF